MNIAAAIKAAAERHVQRRRLELAKAWEAELAAEARRFGKWLSTALAGQAEMSNPWGEIPFRLGAVTDRFRPWVQRYADFKVRKRLPLQGFEKTGSLIRDLRREGKIFDPLFGRPSAEARDAVYARVLEKFPTRRDIGNLPGIGDKLTNPRGEYRPAVEAFASYWAQVAPKRALERAKRKVFIR